MPRPGRLRAARTGARQPAARPVRRREDARARRRRADPGRRPRPAGPRAGARRRRRGGPPGRDRRRPGLRARSRASPHEVNVEATRGARAPTPRGRRPAASCSPRPARTTAAWPTRRCRSTEDGRAAPGLALRRAEGRHGEAAARRRERRLGSPTCLRFATVYGVGPAHALRPDRQRVHARPLGRPRARGLRRAVLAPLRPRPRRRRARSAPCSTPRSEQVAGNVFNVGRSGENYRKLDLVEEIRQADRHAARSTYVKRDEDPRDYKVSFDKIRAELGFETLMTVPDGIAEIIARARRQALRRPLRPALPKHPLATVGVHEPTRSSALRPAASAARTSTRSPRRCAPAG